MSQVKIAAIFAEIAANFRKLEEHSGDVARAGEMIVSALRAGNKVLFCGNGGSAGDSQHLAAELMGRFLKERRPLPAVALTVDSSAITAIGNDYGFERVFARQIEGLGRAGDVLVAISTSGNSPNVLLAVETAREMGIASLALTGAEGGRLAAASDVCIKVPASRTDHIQEMHIAVGHVLCGLVEDALA